MQITDGMRAAAGPLILCLGIIGCGSSSNPATSNPIPPAVEPPPVSPPPAEPLVVEWSSKDLNVTTIGIIRGEPTMFVQISPCTEALVRTTEGGCVGVPFEPENTMPSSCSVSGSNQFEGRTAIPLTGYGESEHVRRLLLNQVFSAFASELPIRFAYDQNACATFNQQGSSNNWPAIVGAALKTPIYEFVY